VFLKKNSFIEGTIIATVAIVLVKILGMLYVIPFYATVGVQGAALYAYAYNIYSLFLEISTAGIPNAVSKLINEYNTLNKQEAKIRTFKLGKKILGFIAITAFIILFVFAPLIAKLIMGDMAGANSVEDISFVIRCVSFALLIFPFLSVSRGFFQGHNIIYVSSFSQVIEQVARVSVIIFGSYIALNFLGLSNAHAVGVATFGAFIGGFCAYLYVRKKLVNNKKELALDTNFLVKDEVTNKEIIKKIISYAIPVVIVSIAFTIYNNIDMILTLRVMDYIGSYEALEVEFIATAISTWASKISLIVTSIGLGLSSSMIPAMVEAYTLKNYTDVNHKFNKAIEIIIFITVPMCIGISLLSGPIWTIFYGESTLGASILAVCIFSPLFTNLFTVSNFTLQSMNKFKIVYISAISGILINTLLDVPFMLMFDVIGIPAYYGATLATVVGLGFALVLAMLILKKEYNFKYNEIKIVTKKCLVPLSTMIVVVLLMRIFLPINLSSRASCIMFTALISVVGAIVYFIVSKQMGLIEEVLGKDFLEKVKNKFSLKKKRSVKT